MKVAEIMTTAVRTCSPRDSLRTAAKMMYDHDCGCLPVTDADYVVGLLTDRDICMAALREGNALQDCLVESAMSENVCVCGPNEAIEEAERIMSIGQVRRVPVLDAEARLVGILSVNDIILALANVGGEQRAPAKMKNVVATLASICAHRPNERSSARSMGVDRKPDPPPRRTSSAYQAPSASQLRDDRRGGDRWS
jgi:CBS domain-containing protein